LQDWKGKTPDASSDPNQPLIPDSADLKRQPLALLEAEISRIAKLVSLDQDSAKRFEALSKRISEEAAAVAALKEKLTDCEQGKERARVLADERQAAYARVFESIVAEEEVLRDLYRPLMARLEVASGTLAKLSFSVKRVVDVSRWAKEGELLFDLRQHGPFKGRGTLNQIADLVLAPAWQHGSPEEVTGRLALPVLQTLTSLR
jgi:hypothetical protein